MKISIVGTVGVPGRYGGFETLAENLVKHWSSEVADSQLEVWCSSKGRNSLPDRYEGARLRYVGLDANGAQSILYDGISIFRSVLGKSDCLLLLGVSGAWAIPLVRVFSRSRVVTNVDGVEWRREKWGRVASAVLHALEWLAVRCSHTVIADNEGISNYISDAYGRSAKTIAYGGDHALLSTRTGRAGAVDRGAFALALCRIEPENNVELILRAWRDIELPLVFVGNWSGSSFGRQLQAEFGESVNVTLMDPVYEPDALFELRSRATLYIHGHSAGGTNPSLVEMMHFGIPVIGFDCSFNRFSTEGKASYFGDALGLSRCVNLMQSSEGERNGASMLEIAQRRYTWARVGEQYRGVLR
ncbi:DUF1972 domain-containing protein [Planctomycetota bacterium]|nr:DUF1972 domain-containing protein [Planctomycetota bacterium]